MGRPPTPSAVKALRGTLRPDRMNADEPQPAPASPRPRRGLSREARIWHQRITRALQALRVLAGADALVVEITARAGGEYDQHAAILDRDGYTYTTTNTVTGSVLQRPRPEVRLAQDAWKRTLAGLVQLGLSPVMRTRLHVLPDPDHPSRWVGRIKAPDPIEQLRRRRRRREATTDPVASYRALKPRPGPRDA